MSLIIKMESVCAVEELLQKISLLESAIVSLRIQVSQYERNQKLLAEFAEGYTAHTYHQDLFDNLTRYIADVTGLDYILIGKLTEFEPDQYEIDTLAITAFGRQGLMFCHRTKDGPFKKMSQEQHYCLPRNCRTIFPNNQTIIELDVEGYIGFPLFAADGAPVGIIAAMNKNEIKQVEFVSLILQLAAKRCEFEFDRMFFNQQLQTLAAKS